MFSQRNNPYCDLLSICKNVNKINLQMDTHVDPNYFIHNSYFLRSSLLTLGLVFFAASIKSSLVISSFNSYFQG